MKLESRAEHELTTERRILIGIYWGHGLGPSKVTVWTILSFPSPSLLFHTTPTVRNSSLNLGLHFPESNHLFVDARPFVALPLDHRLSFLCDSILLAHGDWHKSLNSTSFEYFCEFKWGRSFVLRPWSAGPPHFSRTDFFRSLLQSWDVPRLAWSKKREILCRNFGDVRSLPFRLLVHRKRLLERAPPIISLSEIKKMQSILVEFNIENTRRIHFEGYTFAKFPGHVCPMCEVSGPVIDNGIFNQTHSGNRDTADVNYQTMCFLAEMAKKLPLNSPPKNPFHHQACTCNESPENWRNFFGNFDRVQFIGCCVPSHEALWHERHFVQSNGNGNFLYPE